jgi:hypothetical protein
VNNLGNGRQSPQIRQKDPVSDRKLDFVNVNRTGWVTGLASSRTLQQLYQAIDNGMYAMIFPTKPGSPDAVVSQKPSSCPITDIVVLEILLQKKTTMTLAMTISSTMMMFFSQRRSIHHA